MATKPLIIDTNGCISQLSDGMPLQVNPAVGIDDAPQMIQVQALVATMLEETIRNVFAYQIQYSPNDIQAGVAALPTGCVYLVYE
jgi:hypothetical protein